MRASVAVVVAVVVACAQVQTGEALLENVIDVVSETVAAAMGDTARAPSSRGSLQVQHAEGVSVVDFSHTGLPKVRTGARVLDLVHGGHWDDLQQDTPDEMRPPSVIAFYNSSDAECMRRYNALNWDTLAEQELPARERLMTARYDMYSAERRPWYKFTPEMDLAKRFGVSQCPELVFTPRACNGETRWCERGADPEDPNLTLVGCEDFTEQCEGFKSWDGEGVLKAWILKKVRAEGAPEISPFLRTMEEQGAWIKNRDHTTTDNHLRNMYLSAAFPAFTRRGFKAMPIPPEFDKWLQDFYDRNKKRRRTESWDAGSTQMLFDRNPTSLVSLDIESRERDRVANEYLKPLVEEWTGLHGDLELTSFYGMREYPDGSVLKNHVDRIDTHVISVTISVRKLDEDKAKANPWPLEVVDWNGDHVRYEHPGHSLVLYESSKLMHGRPFPNEGGEHVGCFAHFKPRTMHSKDAGRWDSIVSVARDSQRRNTQRASYRSTPSEEPDQPKFTSQPYGEGTRWKHLDEEDNEPMLRADGVSVQFKNGADQVLDVFWVSHEGEKVHQGTMAPGASFNIKSYHGHKFHFCPKGSQKALPGGIVTVERGRRVYEYSVSK